MSDNSSHDLQQHLQQLLSNLQLDDAPAGGSLVVYQAGRCIAQVCVGMAQTDTPWQPDTLSLNFSTGKGVLATLVHVLVSNKLLDYDTPIADYWSEFAANGKAAITLRQVMSHQANLFSINAIDVDNATLLDWSSMLNVIADISTAKINNADAFVSAYSALVYGWILGGLVERVTDMSLAKALAHYLTEPLGIADSCYFGVSTERVGDVAKMVKDFKLSKENDLSLDNSDRKRPKPVLRTDSEQTLATYEQLPSYKSWKALAMNKSKVAEDTQLSAVQINQLYFEHSAIDALNYRAALVPASKQPINFYSEETLQAVLPAANGVASAQALAIIYAMLASGGVWQGKTLIDETTFAELSNPQVDGMDAVMPATMNWRLGYHKLFSICQNNNACKMTDRGFGHMGYNGSVAWCDPMRELSFAYIHNFDVIMLNDIRQFALTEAVITLVDAQV